MDRLITILRAAHCRSTHHFFAVDAIPLVGTTRGKALCSVLLKHHDRYLVGAKDPDKKFRDFRNHVLHVGDGYWGGAPKTSEKWYRTLIECLDDSRWSDAAYAAGVLSHYFTDPLMPLHTAQTKRESVVHRPLEWSVTKSYDKIHRRWQQGDHKVVFELAGNRGWIGQAVIRGAEVANRYYEELVEDYNLTAGAKRPTEGFDDRSIDTLAGLFGIAITGWARILERAAEQTHAEIPDDSLSIATLVATIKMPVAWIVRRIESRAEQKAVKAIFEEYQQTGKVKRNLPAEVKSVREERQRDRELQQEQERPHVLPTTPVTANPIVVESADDLPRLIPFPTAVRAVVSQQVQHANLVPSDDLVDAPSIGPKTAKRFAAIGITTVEQFLAGSPVKMSEKLDTRWITADKLRDWQDQAQLVCDVPSLCGYKSQLLVGVECRSAQALGSEDAPALHSKIAAYCATSAGKRALRSSGIPTAEDVAQWIRDAPSTPQRKAA